MGPLHPWNILETVAKGFSDCDLEPDQSLNKACKNYISVIKPQWYYCDVAYKITALLIFISITKEPII